MPRPLTRLEAALLEFQQAPLPRAGILRRPAVLFASLREVLLLAGARPAEDGSVADPGVQQAARAFVRQALLFPQADHYQLLGLEPAANAGEIKERYRLLMRLIHPDFAQALPAAWPEDAAVRVNLAYEALSSPARRAAYDRLSATSPLTAEATVASAPVPLTGRRPPPPYRHRRDPARGTFLRLAAGFGLFGVAVVGLLVLVGSFQERETIIQHEALSRAPATGQAPGAGWGEAAGTAVPPPMASFLRRLTRAPAASAAASSRPVPMPVPVAESGQDAGVSPATPVPAVSAASGAVPGSAPMSPLHGTGGLAPALQGKAAAAFARPPAGVLTAPIAATDPDSLATLLPTAQARPSAPAAAAANSAPAGGPLFVAAPVAAAPVLARPSPSLAQAQPILLAVLHQLESADAERVLARLDQEVRSAASAQGFVRHFQAAVEGARSVKLAGVNLQAEPRDGRLVVSGLVRLQVDSAGGASSARELPMVAEFSHRDGVVALTGLALGPGAR